MKVALVHDYLREYGGAERVLDVLHEMYPDAPVFTSYYFAENMPAHYKTWDIRVSPMQHWPFVKKYYYWYTYLLPWCFEQFDLKGFDLVISSSSFAAKGVITHPKQEHICYCHTPPRFLWGLNTQTKRRGIIKNAARILDIPFRKWDYAAAQRVDHYVANSKTVQERIKRLYNRDSVVIYPPCLDENNLHTNAQPLSEGYFLVVSRLFRPKHIEVIIKAFNTLDLKLVIVGTGAEEANLKSLAGKNITFKGFVSDEERAILYSRCRALVSASENEDFGMTIPEAASYGKPAIVYRSGGHKESVEERVTGIFFDHLTPESLIEAVHSFEMVLFEPATIMNHARKFSVQSFKKQFSELVNQLTSKL